MKKANVMLQDTLNEIRQYLMDSDEQENTEPLDMIMLLYGDLLDIEHQMHKEAEDERNK